MQNWLFKQGEARGMAHGEASALLRILERRAVTVPDEARSRILACTNTTQLDAWLDRAVTATRIEDVFADPTT